MSGKKKQQFRSVPLPTVSSAWKSSALLLILSHFLTRDFDHESFSHNNRNKLKICVPKSVILRDQRESNQIKSNLENKPCFSSEYHLSLFQSLFIQFQRKAFSLPLSLSLVTWDWGRFWILPRRREVEHYIGTVKQ